MGYDEPTGVLTGERGGDIDNAGWKRDAFHSLSWKGRMVSSV